MAGGWPPTARATDPEQVRHDLKRQLGDSALPPATVVSILAIGTRAVDLAVALAGRSSLGVAGCPNAPNDGRALGTGTSDGRGVARSPLESAALVAVAVGNLVDDRSRRRDRSDDGRGGDGRGGDRRGSRDRRRVSGGRSDLRFVSGGRIGRRRGGRRILRRDGGSRVG